MERYYESTWKNFHNLEGDWENGESSLVEEYLLFLFKKA